MKYVLTLILLIGISTVSITKNSMYIEGSIDWYQSGMHFKTVKCGGQYNEGLSINTVNITLDSLTCLKLQKDLKNGK